MYLLSVLGVIMAFVVSLLFMGGGERNFPEVFLDVPSLLVLLIVCIPILLTAGVIRDLGKGIQFTIMKKVPQSIVEIKRAHEAVRLVIHTFWSGGLLITLLHVIWMFSAFNVAKMGESVWYNWAVLLLVPFYALVIITLLLPLKAKLNLMMIEFLHREKE